MKGPGLWTRHDLVSELTRGVELPLAPLSEEHLIILAQGLCQAFHDIRDNPAVATGSEPDINAWMEARLNTLHQDNPLWRQLVSHVGRGKECVSYDGSHIEKRPDFSIVLTTLDRRHPLVVEAKILDAASSRRVSLYCRNGIRRFVEGEYAWGNHEAFMIGYVRDGSSIERTLKPFLLKPTNRLSLNYLGRGPHVPTIPGSFDFEQTMHDRTFEYGNQQPPNTPGPITIWHLWLSA